MVRDRRAVSSFAGTNREFRFVLRTAREHMISIDEAQAFIEDAYSTGWRDGIRM